MNTLALPRLDPVEIAEKIAQLSRQPFRDQVAKLLFNSPTDGAIVALAERSPDRYWQAVAIAARLAGYTDKLEVEATMNMRIGTMSDAELQAEVDAATKSLNDTLDFPSKGHQS